MGTEVFELVYIYRMHATQEAKENKKWLFTATALVSEGSQVRDMSFRSPCMLTFFHRGSIGETASMESGMPQQSDD